MNPFLKTARAPDLGAIDPKAILGYIERQALPIANETAARAQALHDARPSAATKRRAESLRGKAESLAHAAELHRKNLALSGLLDDYLREQEEFRERFRPRTGGSQALPPLPFTPAKPLPPPEAPSTVRYFHPVEASDRFFFCKIVRMFDEATKDSDATAAVTAFRTLLGDYPQNQWNNIIDYIESSCPSPRFFYSLVGGRTVGPPTEPYVAPGKPVPTVDIYPRRVPVPEVPKYVPIEAPGVPSIYVPPVRTTTSVQTAPIQTSVPAVEPGKESGMAPACVPPRFWDGKTCRASVPTTRPTIPGTATAVAPMVSTGPGLTGVFLLSKARSGGRP